MKIAKTLSALSLAFALQAGLLIAATVALAPSAVEAAISLPGKGGSKISPPEKAKGGSGGAHEAKPKPKPKPKCPKCRI